MALSFPASPTEGQVFKPGGNVNYVYTSSAWAAVPRGVAEQFNYFVNPSFQQSNQNGQVNNSQNGWHSADQWQLSCNPNSCGIQTDRQDWRSWPNGSRWRYRTNVYAAKASFTTNEYACSAWQTIEGTRLAPLQWGTANAKTVILRFWLYGQQGTYTACLRDSTASRSYCAPFTYTAGEHNSIKEFVFVIPGCTTGTWPTDTSTALQFCLTWACGPTHTAPSANTWVTGNYLAAPGQTNWLATAGNTCELMDMGLYRDPDGTNLPPPWQKQDDGKAFMDSLRYWCKTQGLRGVSASANLDRAANQYIVSMRVAPTCAIVGACYAWDQATSSNLTGIAASYAGIYSLELTCSTAAVMSSGRACFMPSDNAAGALYIATNART